MNTDYKYPIYVGLKLTNPWKSSTIKVNNIEISTKPKLIYSKEELLQLKPLEKYLVISFIPEEIIVTPRKEEIKKEDIVEETKEKSKKIRKRNNDNLEADIQKV
jgi:hypothetical protein